MWASSPTSLKKGGVTTDILSVISQMAILLAIIAVGFAAAKCKVFPEGTNKVLAQLVIVVTNPCIVLHSVLGSDRILTNSEVLLLTAIALGVFAVLIALGRLLPKLLRCPKKDIDLYRFMITFANMGFMGFPVVKALYGDGAVFYASIFNLVFQFVVYTYGVALLAPKDSKDRFSWKTLVSPIIIASVLAYIFYLTDFEAPKVIVDGLGMLGNVTSPVAMLVLGIALSKVSVKEVFGNWRLYVLNFVRLLVLPVCAYFILRNISTDIVMLGIPVVMLGMPMATLTTLMSAKYGGNERLAASGVFISTLMSFITIPLLMWVLFA